MNFKYLHTWTVFHFANMLQKFVESTLREELTKPGAPIYFIPKSAKYSAHEKELHSISQ
ncbi:MAG TPA: hypothetical protein PKA90_02405 [Ignavibacteria bacterium]|nr:hypothetical protein [Ignavibacteria bacterium]HMR39259.1 hypothetical protein [Ignavibacteria bacterium]